jgi:predicted dinucleotide-utilizing enzyme
MIKDALNTQVRGCRDTNGHLEKYSLEAGRSAIEVAVVSVSGLMGAGLSSRLFEAATRAIGKTI